MVRIVDALVTAFIARGHRVLIDSEARNATVAVVAGERLAFGIKEKVTRHDRALSPAELRERKQPPYRTFSRPYVYTTTGELTLFLADRDLSGVRVAWRDGKRKRLEDCLNAAVFGFAVAAERKREIRVEQKRREAERQEQERIRRDKEAAAWRERERVKELEEEAVRWRQSEDIRAYVAAAVRAAEGREAVLESRAGWHGHWRRPTDWTRFARARRRYSTKFTGIGRRLSVRGM